MQSLVNETIVGKLKSHGVVLLIFALVVLGVIVWKLTQPEWRYGEGYLDAGLAEIRAQVLASAYKHQSPSQPPAQSNCPLVRRSANNTAQGSAPCFLGLKDNTPGNSSKPLPELPPAKSKQYPKCLRCENVINRPVTIIPANGAFGLGHFLAKKKDNNSIVIIPEVADNSAIRKVTDGNFRIILGLSEPTRGVTIYHPESDRVIARGADGRVALAPISDFTGKLAPAATFELVDGIDNYSAVSFKCIPINGESTGQYLGFAASSTPGGTPLTIISPGESVNGSARQKITFEFDLVDIETGVPVILNKHSGLDCNSPVEGFWDGDGNMDTRDKREVRGFVLAGELGNGDIPRQETNGLGGNNTKYGGVGAITGYQQPIASLQQINISASASPHNGSSEILIPSGLPIDRPFAVNDYPQHHILGKESFADTVGMLPITLDELGKVPDNLFQPASGLAFNNALNVRNQVYKDQLRDNIFKKLNDAKLNPSVQNILDYNTATYNIYQRENQDFSGKISAQDKSNTSTLDNLIADLDKQRVQSMSQDLFFMKNQLEKANARPIIKN